MYETHYVIMISLKRPNGRVSQQHKKTRQRQTKVEEKFPDTDPAGETFFIAKIPLCESEGLACVCS